MFRALHPDCDILVCFDNSMTHKARPPNGLDVNLRNLSDGGKNSVLFRDGWMLCSDGSKVPHAMQRADGTVKGIKTILEERGLFKLPSEAKAPLLICDDCKNKISRKDRKVNNSRCCARYVLSQQPDFLEQKSWLQETCEANDLLCIFYPKFHCELNFIELVWGWLKSYLRKRCTYVYADLKETIPITCLAIPQTFIRKAYRHCFRYMSGYRCGLVGLELERAVKKYKSHRSIPKSLLVV
jgi:transposase